MIGWNNVQEMTRFGMPGVFAHGTFDTWSPGYLMFMAATHNGISRLYETFGNGGSADTQERTLGGRHAAHLVQAESRARRVRWSLRNNNNYEQTGLLVSLNYVANNRVYFLATSTRRASARSRRRRPKVPRRTCCRPTIRAPARRPSCCACCRSRRVEISRATAAFTVNDCPCARSRRRVAAAAADVAAARAVARGGRRRRRDAAPAAPPAPPHADHARVPGGQLHRPHGPALLAHRRRAARLSVLGAERSAEDARTTTPAGRSPKASPCRPFA